MPLQKPYFEGNSFLNWPGLCMNKKKKIELKVCVERRNDMICGIYFTVDLVIPTLIRESRPKLEEGGSVRGSYHTQR